MRCLEKGQSIPVANELLSVLQEMLKSFQEAYILIDAIDECVDSDDLCQMLEELHASKFENLHIFVTSRPDPRLVSELQKIATENLNMIVNNSLDDTFVLTYGKVYVAKDGKDGPVRYAMKLKIP